MFNVHTEKSVH